jgi:hypothetical protein
MAEKSDRKYPRRRREGYLRKSPAICVVVHDPEGKALPDAVVTDIVNTVNEISLEHGYLLSFTRT